MFLLLLVIDLYHNKTFCSLSVNVENVYTPFEVEIEWRRGRVNGFSWGRYIKEELKSFINAWLLLLVERYISVPGLLQVHSDTDLSTSGSKSFILNHHNIAITCSQSRTEHLHKKVTVFTIRWGKQLSIHPQTRPGIRHQSFNEYHFFEYPLNHVEYIKEGFTIYKDITIECEEWRWHSSLILLILLFTKSNIEVSGWLYQTKIHFTHFVYQPFLRVLPPSFTLYGCNKCP